MLQIAAKLLGIIYAPWFTIPYIIVEAQEESVTSYEWPDGSIRDKPWSAKDTQMQQLADLRYKQRWKDDAVDMSIIHKINQKY
jgi:hypothetical protein